MRDMRDDMRTGWRSDDEREFDESYMDEPTGQWGQEGTRYGQPGHGYGQGSETYQGGYGYGPGYQGSQGRGYGYGRHKGRRGYGSEGRGFGTGVYEPGRHRGWQQGNWRGPEWRRGEYGRGEYGERDFGSGTYGETGYDRSGQGWTGRSWTEQQGPFAGRGPKGYRRSDDRIREDVSDRLTDDHWFDASDVDVRVENGMVTLSGKVKSRDDKRRAEDIVMSVSGVKDVINQIHVDQGLLDQVAEALTGEPQDARSNEKVTTRR
jgi:hypothetical protein